MQSSTTQHGQSLPPRYISLARAAQKGSYQDVQDTYNFFVNAGNVIDIDSSAGVTEEGRTALMYACLRGEYNTAEFLISKGANINHRDVRGYSPTSMAATGGQENILRLLISKGTARLDLANDDKNTALNISIALKHYNCAKILIDNEAITSISNHNEGYDALLFAANSDATQLISPLLKSISTMITVSNNNRYAQGDTALTLAIRKGHLEFASQLIVESKNSNISDIINAKTVNGDTPLMVAIQNGAVETAKELVLAGADVTIENAQGKSVIQLAKNKGLDGLANFIIDNESSKSEGSSKGESSSSNQKIDCNRILFDLSNNPTNTILMSSILTSPNNSEWLQKWNLPSFINQYNYINQGPLTAAVLDGKEVVLAYLLDNGAKDRKDDYGNTARSYAEALRNERMIKMFDLAEGNDMNRSMV